MARKPKAIEIPGDHVPEVKQAPAPAPELPTNGETYEGYAVIERRAGWLLLQGVGWIKERR